MTFYFLTFFLTISTYCAGPCVPHAKVISFDVRPLKAFLIKYREPKLNRAENK
jgi:hypothetical protein